MENDHNILDTIRKETIRAVLERAQGEMIKHMAPTSEDEKTPEGVVEELDVAYINRDGVPLAMDIIGPDVADDVELPVIITIHGGGLVLGDRRLARRFTRELAKAGYLTFSIEYRLAPRANVCEQLDDVCAGMDLVGKRLVDYNVDFDRIFLTAESAGAYLAVYVAAMKDSKRLQKAIGYEPTRMRFRALGLISGMFYTNRPDPIGALFSEQFYGDKVADEEFLRFMNPEHPEIVRNLPPSFFVTSRGDFINSYTLDYHKALRRAGIKTKLLYYGEEDLGHSFVSIAPDQEQSQDAITKMLAWFEERANHARQRMDHTPETMEALASTDSRIASGEIKNQKAWQFVRELNSATEAQLDRVAIRDSKRSWTYGQLFHEQERYAQVFSGLGITQRNESRVGLVSSIALAPIVTFYALNMVGVSVSTIENTKMLSPNAFRKVIKSEGITDIIITDTCTDAKLLRDLAKRKEALGLRHIVVIRSSKEASFPSAYAEAQAKRRWRELRRVKDVLFMHKLLREYEGTPIEYCNGANDEAAAIVHTSGTSKGANTPVPLSDLNLNAAATRFLQDKRFSQLRGHSTGMLNIPLCRAYAFVDMMHAPFAMSSTLVLLHDHQDQQYMRPDIIAESISNEGVDVIMTFPFLFDALNAFPNKDQWDFGHVKCLIYGGGSPSAGQVRRARKFLKKSGSDPVIVNGYGISETSAAAIMHICDPDDKKTEDDDSRMPIGRPMPGVEVRILDDEGTWHGLDDGPCTGTMYIYSDANSCGRLGDIVSVEPEMVEGKPYICSNDMVQVDEDGVISHLGRANRYFTNSKGKKFDAGIVEEALAKQPGIVACGIVPTFDRLALHDTVPLLYVQVAKGSKNKPQKIVRQALENVYTHDERVAKNDLPWACVIAKELPINSGGKVDIVSIMTQKIDGASYAIRGSKDKNGTLKGISLERKDGSQPGAPGKRYTTNLAAAGIPKAIQRERRETARNYIRVYGIDNVNGFLKDAVAEVLGMDSQSLEAYSAMARILPGAFDAADNGNTGFDGGLCSSLRWLLPRNIAMQGNGSSNKGVERMGKKNKKKGMPPFGMMPPMTQGKKPNQADLAQLFGMLAAAQPKPKGKKAKGKAPFGPMMPFAPVPPKKNKKGKKKNKGQMPPFAYMVVPMAAMSRKTHKKGHRRPMPPFAPMPGFPPFKGGRH